MTSKGGSLLVLGRKTPRFVPAPRVYAGQMCGVRIPGMPPVPGGAAAYYLPLMRRSWRSRPELLGDSSLVLSWFYDRYNDHDRATIRADWKKKGYLDALLSWPDSRAFGRTPEQFAATCRELIADGFRPCVMLCSKDDDPPNVAVILAGIAPVLPLLVGLIPRMCIGWELSLWLSPTQVQQLIDALAPVFVAAGCRVYVHLQEGYVAFQQPGGIIADFWKANTGKLTGILAQRRQSEDAPATLDWIHDCLERCAGGWLMPDEIIDGHPVDFVLLEITAMAQYGGTMTEAEGDRLASLFVAAPPVIGPTGKVAVVMGSGNGGH